MGSKTWTTSVLALAGLLAPAAPASAAEPAGLPPSIEVRWTGAPGCPDRATMEQRIAERLARYEGPMQAVVAIAFVAGRDGGYTLDLTVTTDTAQTSKRLEAGDCEVLARATSVVVAVAVDPASSTETLTAAMQSSVASDATLVLIPTARPSGPTVSEPSAAPPPEPAPAPSMDAPLQPLPEAVEAPSPAPQPEPPPEQPHDLRFAARPLGGGSAGILPGFGGGLGLALGVLGRAWRVEGQFSHWFSQPETYDDPAGQGADFSLWSGGLRGCGVPKISVVEFPLCGGIELGQLLASGFGAPVTFDQRSLWAAAVLGPAIAWVPRPWIAVMAGLEGMVNIVRPAATRTGGPELFRSAPVAVRVLAGVEFRVGPSMFEGEQARQSR